ncbi:disulfide bond formation protein B [Halalkalicoccus jeotgali]|uniref:Disulfide bond formation protein DsbB n=1 Tax=Halalkalicoccus jeotgali (strain DSM 18796 / CECT 7217 / JCM 14584 / KCTC 4019 / B3) TaxID=795797 RepID=D8J7T9_HALJB|nr:disulfide bond formation protein B [Halalkalicoccus jeotgali]ADJ16109.1 Disulfide bond formation protein DsbB [Halalkalicoccus jeotgali B3]ELY38204.1 Disulfide bond formation protein DsbB [Halalkalicoccus jeotgali B3]
MPRLGSREWLALGTFLAAVATAGSLYFSEGLGFVPCELCWYQRVFMYPLVPVLGIAAFEGNTRVYPTALALAIPGATVAAYHSAIQRVGGGTCSIGGGCTSIQYELLGLSIPNMALVAFLLVIGAVVAAGRSA